MANWPPDPNKPVEPLAQPQQPTGREWQVIERTLQASIEEQRRARRWSIFFKLLGFAYVLFILLAFGRSCSSEREAGGLELINANEPHIAVIDMHGTISADDELNSHDINKALEKAFKNEMAKAVVLDINSPGGSPVQSDEIWLNIRRLKEKNPEKKVYAAIGDIGASGAYYIASAADEIYVNPSSLVGSIGVIMPSYNIEKLINKMGVEDRTITAGEYKDILSLTRPLTDFESQHVKGVIDNVHQQFITAVKQGRGDRLKNPEQNNLFTGLFWTGEQAIALGLADQRGGLYAIEQAIEIDALVNYTPVDPMKQLLEGLFVKMGQGIGTSLQLDMAEQLESKQTPTLK